MRRRGDVLYDRVEQGREIDRRDLHVHCRHTFARGRVHNRRVELGLVRLELDQQVEHFVVDAHRVRAGSVDLVDHDDRRAVERQSLPEDEARLGHGPIERIDDEQHAIHHAEDALHLAAEVGVARGVDDVDLRPFPPDRGVLREDSDAALALERVGIHDALHHDLVLAECSCLPEHFVHEGSLAVIDVRDDRDVTVFQLCHSLIS